MKLKFKAKGVIQPDYKVENQTINGIDFSQFVEGSQFVGNEDTSQAGIYGAEYVDGELVVTLAQTGVGYECTPVDGSHNWIGQPDLLIDASEFSNDTCYIVASSKPDEAVYVKRDNGWTVTQESENELV
jgi:hypothetical protein